MKREESGGVGGNMGKDLERRDRKGKGEIIRKDDKENTDLSILNIFVFLFIFVPSTSRLENF